MAADGITKAPPSGPRRIRTCWSPWRRSISARSCRFIMAMRRRTRARSKIPPASAAQSSPCPPASGRLPPAAPAFPEEDCFLEPFDFTAFPAIRRPRRGRRRQEKNQRTDAAGE